MQYYRCKCGKSYAWGSTGPYACDKCKLCGSNLAWSPSSHQDPKPHEFVAHDIDTDEGPKPLSRCIYCHRTLKDLLPSDSQLPIIKGLKENKTNVDYQD